MRLTGIPGFPIRTNPGEHTLSTCRQVMRPDAPHPFLFDEGKLESQATEKQTSTAPKRPGRNPP